MPRGWTAAVLLSVLTTAVKAQQIYTVTQWPSMCSAIYTSGTQSVIVVQSTTTVTATPTPPSDYTANQGTPFVLQIQQPSTYGTKRQAQSVYWLMPNGNTTTDGTQAAQFYINNGQLRLMTGGYYSTASGVQNEPFAASSQVKQISTNFSITSGQLSWQNPSFTTGGYAQFYKTPAAAVANAQVIVSFSDQGQYTPPSWAPLTLAVRAVGAAVASYSGNSQTVSVVTSILTQSMSSNLPGTSSIVPIFSFAPTSLSSSSAAPLSSLVLYGGSSSSSTTSVSPPISISGIVPYKSASSSTSIPQTLSTVSDAGGTPIGPNRPPLSTDANSASVSSSSQAQLPLYSVLTSLQSSSQLLPPLYTESSSSSSSSQAQPPLYAGSSSLTSSSSAIGSSSSSMAASMSSSSSSISPPVYPSPSLSSSSSSSLSSSHALSSTATSIQSSSVSTPGIYAPVSTSSSSSSSSAMISSPPAYQSTTSSSSTSSSVVSSSVSVPAQYSTSSSAVVSSSSIQSAGIYGATSSVASSTVSTAPVVSSSAYACPAVNGQTVVDYWGVPYIVGCAQDTTNGNYDSQGAANSWNECFYQCHNSNTTQGAGRCTAFTYSGGTNGNGAGTCFLKDQSGMAFTGSGTNLVAAIQVAYYAGTASSSLSSMPSAMSSSSSHGTSTSTTTSTATSTTTMTTTSSLAALVASSHSSTITSIASSSAVASTTSISSSTSSTKYLVLATPTTCGFGDVAGTDEDDSYCEIDLPFSVTMYSVTSARTYASTNGYISLGNGSSQYQVNPLPFSGIPNNTVLPLFDDLFISGSASPTQGIFYQANSSGVTWEYYLGRANVSTAINHFTVGYSLATPGIFTYTYYNVGNGFNGNTSCVGIQGQNLAGTEVASQFSYQTASIVPGSVIVCNTLTNACTRSQ